VRAHWVRGSSTRMVDQLRSCRKATSFAIDLSRNCFKGRSGTGFAKGKRCNPSRALR